MHKHIRLFLVQDMTGIRINNQLCNGLLRCVRAAADHLGSLRRNQTIRVQDWYAPIARHWLEAQYRHAGDKRQPAWSSSVLGTILCWLLRFATLWFHTTAAPKLKTPCPLKSKTADDCPFCRAEKDRGTALYRLKTSSTNVALILAKCTATSSTT